MDPPTIEIDSPVRPARSSIKHPLNIDGLRRRPEDYRIATEGTGVAYTGKAKPSVEKREYK